MIRFGTAIVAVTLAGPLHAQQPDSLPAGVTPATITDGKAVFEGPGLCTACHGPQAKGVRGLGPDLTDAEWLHSDGSYEALIDQITTGVPADESTTGLLMPPKGGTALSKEQVRAVAAYVWSLSHSER
jgi:mono/diheme cytochrome c family protein